MDIYLILLIIALPLIAQSKVKNSYARFAKIKNSSNLTGYEIARKILDSNGLDDIKIVETQGELTDHYDPTKKVIRLSSNIYSKNSISAAAVAAHEVGHAIQHKERYLFLTFRTKMVPIVNFTSKISTIMLTISLVLGFLELYYLSIILMLGSLAFQLITLPVEFNASNRAKKQLINLNIITNTDQKGISSVLSAAAFTYVAGFLATALQIARLLLMTRRRD
jgi:Zn-dependent membrane protease YugP